jgi:hypothetical protein
VTRREAIELAEQQRQVKVLLEQQKREGAEKDRLLVSAQREEAAQAVKTVEATQSAQRDARILVIEAEREAQQAMIGQKNTIELEALRKQRQAEAQAIALQEIATAEAAAALKQAETLRTQALAAMEAAKPRADGARATAAAAGWAEAEVLQARAEAGMRVAEAIRAKGLAVAESEKAKAEALAAYDGVAQRVELVRLQLDAQVRIEVARSEAMGHALASMNVKMIGDPAAAAALLRMVTMADGLGEIVNAAPLPLKAVGQQLLNKVTGQANGDALLRPAATTGNGHGGDETALARLVPELMALVEKRLDVNALSGQTVSQVLAQLGQRATAEEQPLVAQGRSALERLPIVGDLPFEEVYLRAAAAKG